MKSKGKSKSWNGLERVFCAAFLIWSAAGLLFTVLRITPDTIDHWSLPPVLALFIDLCLQYGDPILIILACANTHLHAVRQWSAGEARRWGACILVSAYAVEAVGVNVGLPFGPYQYTDHFGPMLGPVPLTIPLAWHVVVTNALFVVRAVVPFCSRFMEAALAGLLCTLYDVVLEPFATTVKDYWRWDGGSVPPLNYIAWFVISALLIRIWAPTISTRHRFDPRPWLILGFTIVIFAAGRWAYFQQ